MRGSLPKGCETLPVGDTDPLLMILKRLSEHGVDYVLVGAFAAMGHGTMIVTHDVDICAPLVRPNLDRIVAALGDLNPYFRFRPSTARLPLYDDPARLVGFKNIYLITDWGTLEILGEMPDLADYGTIAMKAVEADFGSFKCKMIDLDSLIAAKKIAGRPKDLAHLKHLEAIKKKREAASD